MANWLPVPEPLLLSKVRVMHGLLILRAKKVQKLTPKDRLSTGGLCIPAIPKASSQKPVSSQVQRNRGIARNLLIFRLITVIKRSLKRHWLCRNIACIRAKMSPSWFKRSLLKTTRFCCSLIQIVQKSLRNTQLQKSQANTLTKARVCIISNKWKRTSRKWGSLRRSYRARAKMTHSPNTTKRAAISQKLLSGEPLSLKRIRKSRMSLTSLRLGKSIIIYAVNWNTPNMSLSVLIIGTQTRQKLKTSSVTYEMIWLTTRKAVNSAKGRK